jgi:hypothetical protein
MYTDQMAFELIGSSHSNSGLAFPKRARTGAKTATSEVSIKAGEMAPVVYHSIMDHS